mmetsp:Transcript_47262/g.101173  ORF Transcript_47262/g.101173 Transcript_47262/m.101173 type:complete len:576 (-) Transcript_47262:248-1975(-)|eukprot:CAMPEP_0206446640 /NCGR_PEP_ID=MMETSP0324_2-20121206/16261_1 /ASSEMBLY_ACC=CAM_ASM_000836 /TAXON_ID=2866 /ORGANISM="Crypthecodinium cohnii, Strain Seligo" /LENGTH=575 /DNA_ID=CAMNT_0053915159 /DNA_START=373 /DNA_END=2100 /DNA_ORIENTATION=+
MIDYEDTDCLLAKIRGSVVPKAIFFSLPSILIALAILIAEDLHPGFLEESGMDDIDESLMWNAMTGISAVLIAFRTRQALGRFWEGTGLLHQMRGEWFDSVSCLTSFSRDAKMKGKEKEVEEFRHTLIRLMSLMHGSALDEIGGGDDLSDNYEVLDIKGLDMDTLLFLRHCKSFKFNRVEALQHMIQVLVTANHHSGVLTIPPPILSRIYQTLSRGLVNLLNAKKIKDTRFPFPYSQVIIVLIYAHSIFTPAVMTQLVENKVVCCALSFLPVFGLVALNLIAGELEMPFGHDENDLPLQHFQEEFNYSLLMLIHEKADHIPHTSDDIEKSFDVLFQYMSPTTERQLHSHSKVYLRDSFIVRQGGDLSGDQRVRKLVTGEESSSSMMFSSSFGLGKGGAAPRKMKSEDKAPAPPALTVAVPVAPPPVTAAMVPEAASPSSTKGAASPTTPASQSPAAPGGGKDLVPAAAANLQALFDKFNEAWSKRADVQVAELKKNSEALHTTLQTMDRLFSRNTEAVLTFTQALPHELRRNTEVMAVFSETLPKMLDALLVCSSSAAPPGAARVEDGPTRLPLL